MNTYTKLKSGEWGIRVEGAAVAGQSVAVQKKDGKVETKTISKVLWTGKDNRTGKTISLCAIRASMRQSREGECRCRYCLEWTPEGDDWCTHCGQANYE